MDFLDPETLMEWAGKVSRLKMYPYFDICHYALMCMAVRDDLATGATLFSRKHPLSCWLSSMIMCFAGSFLANFLLGEPVIVPFKRQDDLLLASIVWYFVFYSPFDLTTKIIKFTPVKLGMSILKEVQRAHKVHHGVLHAAKTYPSAYVVMIMVGTAKGAGSGILKTFEQLVRGVWVPTGNEILRPSFYTKECIMASVIFMLDTKGGFFSMPHELVYLAVVVFFVYFKIAAVLFGVTDPFVPFENLFCALFMGGIWDALSRALAASRERRSGAASSNADASGSEQKKDQ